MSPRITSWLSRPSLMRMLISHARLAWRLLREPSVPLIIKAVPVAAALYLISPIDLIPDALPVLGEIDDLGILVAAIGLFVRLAPVEAAAFHRDAIARRARYTPMSPAPGDFIDAEFRRE